MDVNRVRQFLNEFTRKHRQVLSKIPSEQHKQLELAATLGAAEHYRSKGLGLDFQNPRGNKFVVKTGTRGHPAKYSRIVVDPGGRGFEIHMNLCVRSAHDRGIYCVDVGVTDGGLIPRHKNQTWECLDNDRLITFAEAKSLPIYPMLLAQFVGIVHEIKPTFIGGAVPSDFTAGSHFFPALVSLGHFPKNGNAETIVKTYDSRGIHVCVAEAYDSRLALLRGGARISPFDRDIFQRNLQQGGARPIESWLVQANGPYPPF